MSCMQTSLPPVLFPVLAVVDSLGSAVGFSGVISLHFYDRPQKLQLPPPADTHLMENPWHSDVRVLLPERKPLLNKQSFSACSSKPLRWTRFVQGISSAA